MCRKNLADIPNTLYLYPQGPLYYQSDDKALDDRLRHNHEVFPCSEIHPAIYLSAISANNFSVELVLLQPPMRFFPRQ